MTKDFVRLISVEDAKNNDDGFKNGKSLALEYEYDANSPSRSSVGSNMVDDENKGITHIRGPAFRGSAFRGSAFRGSAFRYNHLNLPERVTKVNGDYVKYIYDAAGLVLDSIRELS